MGKLTDTTGLSRTQLRGVVALVVAVGMIGYYSGLMVERGRNLSTLETVLDVPPEIKGAGGELHLTYHDTLVDGKELPLGSGKNATVAKSSSETPKIPERTEDSTQSQQHAADDPISKIIAKTETQVTPKAAPEKQATVEAVVRKKVLMLQAGSFADSVDAHKLQESLSEKGYPARVSTVDLGEKGVWHRVILDPYSSMSEAVKVASKLKTQEKINVLLKERK